ncbi:MAG: hypothetical protein J6I55_01585 [Ruminococcus sp.]|nr:hypothetical protein [Ruminococcus sp.]
MKKIIPIICAFCLCSGMCSMNVSAEIYYENYQDNGIYDDSGQNYADYDNSNRSNNNDDSLFPETITDIQPDDENAANKDEVPVSSEEITSSTKNTSVSGNDSSKSKNVSDTSSSSRNFLGYIIFFVLGTALGAIGTWLSFSTTKLMKKVSMSEDDAKSIEDGIKNAKKAVDNILNSSKIVLENIHDEEQRIDNIKTKIDI